eukprot:5577295-Alexandrium_andersonii.AAC.1
MCIRDRPLARVLEDVAGSRRQRAGHRAAGASRPRLHPLGPRCLRVCLRDPQAWIADLQVKIAEPPDSLHRVRSSRAWIAALR